MSQGKVLLVMVVLVAGAAVLAGIAFFASPTGTNQVAPPSATGTRPPPTTSPTVPVRPNTTPLPGLTPPATPKGAVDFDLLVSQVEPPKTSVLFNVTLQAHLNASLTNLGDSDAHNAQVQIRARVGSSHLKMNDADPFVVRIGDLPARVTATQSLLLEIKMSLAQGNRAQNEGINFEITVLSNERTKRFPDMRCTQAGCT